MLRQDLPTKRLCSFRLLVFEVEKARVVYILRILAHIFPTISDFDLITEAVHVHLDFMAVECCSKDLFDVFYYIFTLFYGRLFEIFAQKWALLVFIEMRYCS